MRETAGGHDEWGLGEQIAARLLALYAESFGGVDELWEGNAAAPVALPLGRASLRHVPPKVLNDLCNRAVNRLAVHEGGGRASKAMGSAHWRVVLYTLTGASTLREAIARCSDCFEAIDGRAGYMTLRASAEGAELRLDGGLHTTASIAGVISIYGLAEIHRLFAALIARPLPLQRICLDGADPWLSTLDPANLPCPLSLGAGWTGFVIPSAYLDHPVTGSADDLSAIAQQSFLFQPEAPVTAPALVDPVRRLTLRALRDRQRLPLFEEIVGALGLSAATLRRRLAAEGTTYREIKDSCRREVGLNLLRRPDLPIEEIAARLDFCDADAFRRAFHSWFGMAPSQYRQAAGRDTPKSVTR